MKTPRSKSNRLPLARARRPVPVLIAVAVVAVGIFTLTQSFAATVYPAAQWQSSLDSAINSDDSQSVALPDGRTLWAFGDTIQVNGASTVRGLGYPHDAFITQAPGSLTLTPVPGKYGLGWQQVPNWSDGTYFWASTPIVDQGTLYLLGQRIKGVNPFTVLGSYVASFNAKTLAFQKVVPVPAVAGAQTVWGGVAKGRHGWWITGTHGVPCSYATDCKVGDIAWVPFGRLANAAKWQLTPNVIPAAANIGTTLGLVQTPAGWDIFTKTGDSYGGTTIERLGSTWPTKPWTITTSWPVTAPAGAVSYGVAVHPEQSAPAGQVLVSYNVNNFAKICYPLFLYLSK